MLHVYCRMKLRKYAEHQIDSIIWTAQVQIRKVHTKYCNVINWTSGCHFLNLLSMQLCIVTALHAAYVERSWEITVLVMGHSGQWSMVLKGNYMLANEFLLLFSFWIMLLGCPPLFNRPVPFPDPLKMQSLGCRQQTGPSAGLSASDELC